MTYGSILSAMRSTISKTNDDLGGGGGSVVTTLLTMLLTGGSAGAGLTQVCISHLLRIYMSRIQSSYLISRW